MQHAIRAGVLALQGSFEPHARALVRLGFEPVLVRSQADLAGLTHLILPGGESTTMNHLLELFGLRETLRAGVARGDLAVFGTCAGAILLGGDDGTRPPRLGLFDATLARNAYGSQVDSFQAPLEIEGLAGGPLIGKFIRAPKFSRVGPRARVLARHDGDAVLVEHGNVLAATFHPELGNDDRLLQLFLSRQPSASTTC